MFSCLSVIYYFLLFVFDLLFTVLLFLPPGRQGFSLCLRDLVAISSFATKTPRHQGFKLRVFVPWWQIFFT